MVRRAREGAEQEGEAMRGQIISSSRPIAMGNGLCNTVSSTNCSVVGGGGVMPSVVSPAEQIGGGRPVSCFVNHPMPPAP